MTTGTVKFIASERPKSPGAIVGPSERWLFTYDAAQRPLVSSRRKLVYRGTFSGAAFQGPFAARAVAFDANSAIAFGSECANLGHLSSLGVGPKLLAITQHDFGTGTGPSSTILEEDAGENLATLIGNRVLPNRNPVIHQAGTLEREIENRKILYDVFVQVQNAHRAGIYHRDLRCENVCVRRFGDAPADIRATVIDFELGSALGGGEPGARASLFGTIFREVPSHLAGEPVSLAPNPLELDMGYLATFQYHLEHDALLLNGEKDHQDAVIDNFVRFLDERVRYFAYREHAVEARHIEQTLDIDDTARSLKLVPVNEESFPSGQLLAHAESFHKPYLDGEDMRTCMAGPRARLAAVIDDIVAAKFETYKALRRAQGLDVPYERYDAQPMSLQRSNYAQSEHIPEKVHALGYLLVSEFDGSTYEEVTSFSEEQIEDLARLEHERWTEERLAAGWTLKRDSTKSDPVALTSPYLIPYDELPERVKEYDRDPVRQIIGLVRIAGLTVVRPK